MYCMQDNDLKLELIAVLESIKDPHAVTSGVIMEAVISSFDNMVST